ncbi:MAG: hypothetical protein ACQCN5_13100 [Candidatus Bathyarchaeia archaeon]|jgi:hypothetical protein
MNLFFKDKKCKETLFQVLLLDNDADLNVQVQEAPWVDYSTVKEHLKNGGSVFITSKKQQKILTPKTGKAQQRYSLSRRKYGAHIHRTYKTQNFV